MFPLNVFHCPEVAIKLSASATVEVMSLAPSVGAPWIWHKVSSVVFHVVTLLLADIKLSPELHAAFREEALPIYMRYDDN